MQTHPREQAEFCNKLVAKCTSREYHGMALKGRIDVFPTECTLSYANGAFSEIGRGRSVKKKTHEKRIFDPS